MDEKKNKLTNLLGYLGLLPFLAATVLEVIDADFLGKSGLTYFASYSAIILSFMAGTLWGKVLSANDEGGTAVAFIMSNVFALAAWASLLMERSVITLVILVIGYALLWFTEKNPAVGQSNYCPITYGRLRRRLTIIVVVLHLIVLFQTTALSAG
ncbi:MAG: DUF3429 domain-containing protein [Idiomarina sp.]